jgi:hypothetical protein
MPISKTASPSYTKIRLILSANKIAELCNYNYLKERQEIQTQAINLAQTTLVRSNLFMYSRANTHTDTLKKKEQNKKG